MAERQAEEARKREQAQAEAEAEGQFLEVWIIQYSRYYDAGYCDISKYYDAWQISRSQGVALSPQRLLRTSRYMTHFLDYYL
jgi:hypothetical protein